MSTNVKCPTYINHCQRLEAPQLKSVVLLANMST